MNLISDMKILHAKKFKEGTIKQATFLKSFKKEILELVSLGYKPSEIRGYLEEKLGVSINMNSFYAWLNYSKGRNTRGDNNHAEAFTNTVIASRPSETDKSTPKSTLDVLSSTDFD